MMEKVTSYSVGVAKEVAIPRYQNVNTDKVSATESTVPNLRSEHHSAVAFINYENNDMSKPVVLGSLSGKEGELDSSSIDCEKVVADSATISSVEVAGVSERDISQLSGLGISIQEHLTCQRNNISTVQGILGDVSGEEDIIRRVSSLESSISSMKTSIIKLTDSLANSMSALSLGSGLQISDLSNSENDSLYSVDIEDTSIVQSAITQVNKPIYDTTGFYELCGVHCYINIPVNAYAGMPVIMFMHGSSQVGHYELLEHYGIDRAASEVYGDARPFILVMPNCTHLQGWKRNGWESKILSLCDEIRHRYSVSKIILTGHSLGGFGAWYYGDAYPDIFSCTIPVAAYINHDGSYDYKMEIPVLAICGMKDSWAYPRMKKDVAKLRKNGTNIEFIERKNNGHSISRVAYTKEVFEWALDRRY